MPACCQRGAGNPDDGPDDGGVAAGGSRGVEGETHEYVVYIGSKQDEQLTPEMAKLADGMWRKLRDRKPLKKSSIARVLRPQPPDIPADDYDAFSPKVVSIGPLHRRDQHLKHMRPLKWEMVAELLGFPFKSESAEKEGRVLFHKLVKAIWCLEGDVRGQYAEDIPLRTRMLVKMMVLDGCYVLHILKTHHLIDNPSPGYNMALSLLKNDLMLLENQIPFVVLQTLSDLSGKPGAFVKEKALELLAPDSLRTRRKEKVMARIEKSKPAHLLHLKLLSYIPLPEVPAPNSNGEARHGKRATFSATELHAAGVTFKIKDSDSILDVSFDHWSGVLSIPPLAINKVNMSLFRNLVAFEQCLASTDGHFTGYAVFMDNIINTADDVRLLGRSGVVKNYLASDEEAAKFFNTLYQDVTEDKQNHKYYTNIAAHIDKYRSDRRHGWRVRLQDDYFGSPWSGISVVAAAFALFLTAVQAYFSAFPRGS